MTLAAGSQTTLAAAETLTVLGAIAEHGTLDVLGNGYYGEVAAVDIAGTLSLSGSGLLTLADVSGASTASTTQVVTGTAPGATLDNAALISGFGMLGDGALTLVNEATGTIVATGGTLVVDAGASTDTNLGQMLAAGGTLQLESTLANHGTVAASAGGAIIIDGTVNNTGLVSAASGTSIVLHGSVINGAAASVQIGSNATMLLDGGMVQGGTLSNAAGGTIDVTINGATLAIRRVQQRRADRDHRQRLLRRDRDPCCLRHRHAVRSRHARADRRVRREHVEHHARSSPASPPATRWTTSTTRSSATASSATDSSR